MSPKDLLNQISAIANEVPLHLIKLLAANVEGMTVDNWFYARNQVVQSMPQPNLRVQVGQLLDTWHRENPTLTPQSLALALLAAAQIADQRRRSQSTSLVWTGPTSQGPALRRTDQALLQVINTARQYLLVVSFAVYKIANIRTALVKAAERGVTIKICVEAPEPSEGKMTYDTIKALGKSISKHATVYIWPKDKRPQTDDGKYGSFHVKCAVADEELLFISSANLTEYALTLNMELGVLIKGGPQPRNVTAHFSRLMEDGVLVPVEE
ncbi:MAG: phospholipase [Anaerolineales bacterium]|nr:phospholipase [Anaerolineales bacterium]